MSILITIFVYYLNLNILLKIIHFIFIILSYNSKLYHVMIIIFINLSLNYIIFYHHSLNLIFYLILIF